MTIAGIDEINPGAAYNISTGQPVKIKEILDTLCGMSSAVFDVLTDEHRYAASPTPVTSGNPSRAYNDFGWKATTPFFDTLAKVMNHWRETV
jgi:nucleoside-diphosphate-sugar epimerase